MALFDFEKSYTVDELSEIFEFPLVVRRDGWTDDYVYEIRKIDGTGYTEGVAYKGGNLYSTKGTYYRTTRFYVCEEENPIFKSSSIYSYEDDSMNEFESVDEVDEEDDLKFDDDFVPCFYTEEDEGEEVEDKELSPEQHLETALKLTSGKSLIYVRKDGKWIEAVYLRFELREIESGKDFVIWVKHNDGVSKFYKYPSDYVAFNIEEKEQKEEIDVVYTTSYEIDKKKTVNISACSDYPRSIPAQADEEIEFKVESTHHETVEAYLLNVRDEQYEKLKEANNLEIEASKMKKSGIREAQENGDFEFNSHFYNAGKLYEKADILKRKAGGEINLIQRIRREPYFGRIDWGPSDDRIHTTYLGEEDVDGFVTDWRNSNVGNLWYHTEDILENTGVKIPLKRRFTFKDYKLNGMTTEINEYVEGFVAKLDPESVRSNTDDMFNKLLEDSRNEQEVHDIIKTIRSNQYDIISSDFDSNIIVDGCAGSGKTMILYHRLSFMAYNDAERFNMNNCYVVTPTARYASLNSKLFEKLKLNELRNSTSEEFIRMLINRYCSKHGIFDSSIFSLGDDVDNSDINIKYLDEKKLEQFYDLIVDIKDDPRDFYIWYTKRINKLLREKGFAPASEIDILLGKNNPLLSQYSSNGKIEKARQEGVFRMADWDAVLDILKERGNSEKLESLWKYEFPLKMVLGGGKNSKPEEVVALFNKKREFEGFLLLQLLDKHISILRDFYKNPEDDTEIFISLCEFAMEQMKKNEDGIDISKTYRFEMLYYLAALSGRYMTLSSERTLIFIDEFQNYSRFELTLIKDCFENAVYNFYGDYSQKMMKCGLSKEDISELFDPYCYRIQENYRNAKEITEFINMDLGINMRPIGVHGTVRYETFEDCEFKMNGRTAVLYDENGAEILKLLSEKRIKINKTFENNKIVSDKVNVLSVFDARGLEFETVYVFVPNKDKADEKLTRNKKYVAYTRALNDLIILTKI